MEMASLKEQFEKHSAELSESKSSVSTYEQELLELKSNLTAAEARLVSHQMGDASASEKVSIGLLHEGSYIDTRLTR